MNPAFVDLEIARHLPPRNCTLEQSEQYARWLATHHYENFSIASRLLPRNLRQHFYNVYAYCRWSDDLADEIPDPQESLRLLTWWQDELTACFDGRANHPVFIALHDTVSRFNIPMEPFCDLLAAFRQDQTVHRYETWESVIDYCRRSANPVGRIVLYLGGYRDRDRQALSDHTCTALQLANFWQDVSRDLDKNRIYIPVGFLRAYGLTESELFARRFNQRYADLMRDLVSRTRDLFALGLPLAASVSPDLRTDIQLFSHGGMAVLDAIESIGYNTLNHRPALTRATKIQLVGRAIGARWPFVGR
jgi:squalene synthase HpnC